VTYEKAKLRNFKVANWVFSQTTHVIGSKHYLAWWVVFGR